MGPFRCVYGSVHERPAPLLFENAACYDVCMTTVAITLRDEDEHFLDEIVKSGRFLTKSEAVAEALSELKVRENVREQRIAALRAKVQVGIEQADRGEFVEFSAQDIVAEGRKKLAAMQAAN